MKDPLVLLNDFKKFKEIESSILKKQKVKIVRPIEDAFPHLLSKLIENLDKNILIVSDKDILKIKKELSSFLAIKGDGKIKVFSLPSLYRTPYDLLNPPMFNILERMKGLKATLKNKHRTAFIIDFPALLYPLPPKRALKKYFLRVKEGDIFEQEKLIKILLQYSYKENDLTTLKGDFSVRGHIVDIFPLNQEFPVRLDFEGDEIFSIKLFDPNSQRTIKKIKEIEIFSLAEFLISEEKEKLKPLLKKKWDNPLMGAKLKRIFKFWSEGLYFKGEELFRIFLDNDKNIFSAFNESYLFDDFSGDKKKIEEIRELWEKKWRENLKTELSINYELFFKDDPHKILEQSDIKFTTIPEKDAFSLPYKNLDFDENSFFKKMEREKEDFFLIFTKSSKIRKRILENTEDKEGRNIFFYDTEIPSGFSIIVDKNLKLNFVHFFGYAEKSHISTKTTPHKLHIGFKEGDFVVHARYGIALFKGMQRVKVKNSYTEFLVLEYAGGDKVYVSIDSLDQIYRYSGPEGYVPPLDKLGSKNWIKTKQKVKSGIFKIAKDLLKLYAKRKSLQVKPLKKIEPDEELFISNFEYEETEDQIKTWEEISLDLSQDKPMDRLLCGDVGFGKTEIAMRATFRAVSNGKQVAILCPTTILADQHFRNFKKRFKGFPYRIEELTRMVAGSKKRIILKELEEGKIDILIGTHAILSEKIRFFDLGLLIIDEEQRFGVKHKDKILKMKENVNVLSLSATPIPRTLNMALSGVKDLSLIESPPPGRMEIATFVEEFNPQTIEQAVKFELSRGGQVYIVYNNINRINTFGDFISRIIPFSRISIIHSKLPNRTIEKEMIDFIERKTDILISTTIIENGIDIENVNTLIVVDAHNFGLSQLYQLRGRIGRGIRKAYAYFLIDTKQTLTEKAKRRLKAIREFQELGSGFRLAAMDLEIRGAGNLLGKEQHGHLKSVGFEYYLWLLNKTIKEMKGEEEFELSPEIRLPLIYAIPETYIPQASQRLNIYKRMSLIKDFPEIKRMEEELLDRFGILPLSVKNLLFIVKTRIYAQKLRITTVEYRDDSLLFEFSPLTRLEEKEIFEITKKLKGEMISDTAIEFYIPGIDKLKNKIFMILEYFLESLDKKV